MDSVLLSLINISHKEPAIPTDQFQPVLSDEQDIEVQPADTHEQLPGVKFILLSKPPTSMREQNIEAYMAGYLLRRAKMDTCETCKQQLIYSILPSTDVYTFLTNKALKIENTLVYPTECFIEFVDKLEAYFVRVFDAVKYMTNVLLRLCKNTDSLCTDFLLCESAVCDAKLQAMVKLYLKVRLFHALKVSNRENKNRKGCKRNRKMLKLQNIWFKQYLLD